MSWVGNRWSGHASVTIVVSHLWAHYLGNGAEHPINAPLGYGTIHHYL